MDLKGSSSLTPVSVNRVKCQTPVFCQFALSHTEKQHFSKSANDLKRLVTQKQTPREPYFVPLIQLVIAFTKLVPISAIIFFYRQSILSFLKKEC